MGSSVCLKRLRALRIKDAIERPLCNSQRMRNGSVNRSRSMATVSDATVVHSDPNSVASTESSSTKLQEPITLTFSSTPITTSAMPPPSLADKPLLATMYSFPYLEPLEHLHFSEAHLGAHMRRDILQRAVVYEADNARAGTASTKWRDEVHGSGRKLIQQKGTGRARVGDKKSPIRRGGGVAHGPKPRDFGTDLPKKVYDQAWRIALSYRYRRGQLVIVDSVQTPEDPWNAPGQGGKDWWIKEIMNANRWGRSDGRSMIIAQKRDDNQEIFEAMKTLGMAGRIADLKTAGVRHVLNLGRLIIERKALTTLLHDHQSDIKRKSLLPRSMRALDESRSSAEFDTAENLEEIEDILDIMPESELEDVSELDSLSAAEPLKQRTS